MFNIQDSQSEEIEIDFSMEKQKEKNKTCKLEIEKEQRGIEDMRSDKEREINADLLIKLQRELLETIKHWQDKLLEPKEDKMQSRTEQLKNLKVSLPPLISRTNPPPALPKISSTASTVTRELLDEYRQCILEYDGWYLVKLDEANKHDAILGFFINRGKERAPLHPRLGPKALLNEDGRRRTPLPHNRTTRPLVGPNYGWVWVPPPPIGWVLGPDGWWAPPQPQKSKKHVKFDQSV